MKALVYTGPKALDYRDAPDPVLGELPGNDCLIEVAHVGICGSDMHAWAGHDDRRPAPLILGHEVAGTVTQGPLAGRQVTVNPLVTCGTCAACAAGKQNLCATRQIISMPPREGGFAEQLAMPADNLVVLPDGVQTRHAALAEPLACGWHAVRLAEQILGRIGVDTACLVQGGGAIGLGAALVLRSLGVADLMLAEPDAARRAMVAAEGITTFDPLNDPGPTGVDLVIDGVGVPPTRAAASAAVRPGGAIVHIGLGGGADGLDLRRITLQEIAFIGSYTYTMQDFRETVLAIFDGRLGALNWTEERPLSQGGSAFDDIAAGRAPAPKILLRP